jgi:outer membrane protein
MRGWIGVATVVIVAGLSVVVTGRLLAQGAPSAAGCACVAVVDLPRVMEGLHERQEAQARLEEMAATMKSEDDDRQQNLKDMRQSLDDLPTTEAEARGRLREETALATLEYQAWRLYAKEQVDIEKSLVLRELNRKMQRAITALADASGYDLVLMDDSAGEIALNPDIQASREAQVVQQITQRRVLHARDSVNITDELIERMNNEFDAR